MKFLTIITFVLSVLFISCGKNDPTKNDNTPPPDFEKGPHLFTIEGVLVGSSGSYSFAVNQFLSFLFINFDGTNRDYIMLTPPDFRDSFGLTNEFLSFEVSLDDNGNPKTEIHIPSHNREIAATAVISEIGDQNQSTSFLPQIDLQMANYEGTIESKLSVDNGRNYRNEIYQSSTYNITLNNGQINGLLKCNTCLDDSIYNVSGTVISTNDTHLSLRINSISNRDTGTETLSQPLTENYTKYTGGLLLKLVNEKTIGIDSILKNEIHLKYIE